MVSFGKPGDCPSRPDRRRTSERRCKKMRKDGHGTIVIFDLSEEPLIGYLTSRRGPKSRWPR